MSFAGLPGVRYELQQSDDLISWAVVQVIAAGPNGEIDHQDLTRVLTQIRCFYRLRQLPAGE